MPKLQVFNDHAKSRSDNTKKIELTLLAGEANHAKEAERAGIPLADWWCRPLGWLHITEMKLVRSQSMHLRLMSSTTRST